MRDGKPCATTHLNFYAPASSFDASDASLLWPESKLTDIKDIRSMLSHD
jgi:hypothetical protein